MFSFLDSSSYCCSGNPFQLDTNIQASDAGSGMQCGEVTLSGPRRCSLITMAHLHRQFIIIILLMKLEFHCLQIRSQHLKKKKKAKGGKSMQTPFLPLAVPRASLCLPSPTVSLPWGRPGCGVGTVGVQAGPQDLAAFWRQQLPSTGPVCPVPPQCPGRATLQTTAALGELGQLNCLVKYKWPGDFLKLEECGKLLGRG